MRHPSGEIVPVRMDHAALEDLDETRRTVGGHRFRFVSTRFDVPVVLSEEDLPADEKGLAGTHVLREVFYPQQRTEPLNDATVYVVNEGRLYADSVRAIYEERVRRGDDREHIWVVKDGAFTPPRRRHGRPGGQPRAHGGAGPIPLHRDERAPARLVPLPRGPGGRCRPGTAPRSSTSATTSRT